jgi:hypothetical protein
MKDPNINDYSMDAWLSEGIEEAVKKAYEDEQRAIEQKAALLRHATIRELAGPDLPTVSLQSPEAPMPAHQQELGPVEPEKVASQMHDDRQGRTKEVSPLHSSAPNGLATLYALFGKPVLIPIPYGKKEPILADWREISFEYTQSQEYQKMLLHAAESENVGILLGPNSERLLTANINDNHAVENLLRDFPWLADTTRSWAQLGCQFWVKLEEGCDYPEADIIPLKRNGRVIGELRLGGTKGKQSAIHGVDPSGVRYQHNGKEPKEIGLSDLFDLSRWGADTARAQTAIEEALFPLVCKELDVKDELLCLDAEPPPPFPIEALPRIFREPVEEVMRHYRVPALMPGTCALVINSAAIGRGVVVKSNVRRTYANLYAVIGAKSGTGKTVVFDEFMAPLEAIQREMLDDFKDEDKPRTEVELKLVQAEVQRLLKFKQSKQEPDLAEDARRERLGELLQQQADLEDKLETGLRLWCVDFTSEALGVLLANNNEQIAVLSDEGGLALHNMLGRYTKGVITDDILLCKAKSVNGTAVDRIGREPLILRLPCVSLLLLVQPDLLRMAFSNERLLIGGFLARCLAADSRMEILYEDENTLREVDPAIMEGWNQHIRGLVKSFRFAQEPYWISVQEEVRPLSREFHNDIVDQIRGGLCDVDSFAVRWVERAWEIALNLHVGLYGIECYKHPLSKETFANAIVIAKYFADRQLEVLNAMRIKASSDSRDRLKEILETNDRNPVTFRDLKRRHGLDREEVLNTVKNHPEVFGVAELRRQSGGTPSPIVFLKSNPPPKMQPKQV